MHYKYRQAGRARTHAHATQGTRAWHSCAHCGPSTRSCRAGGEEGGRGGAHRALRAAPPSRSPPVYGTTGPRLDNNHIHRETHNANRKDAAYYGGVSTRGSPRGPRGGGLPFLFLPTSREPSFYFLRAPLKRRRIETLASTVTPCPLRALPSNPPRFSRPLSPRHSPPLFISSSYVPSFIPFDPLDPSPVPPRACSPLPLPLTWPPPPTLTPRLDRRIRAHRRLTGWQRRYLLRIHEGESYVIVEVYIAPRVPLIFYCPLDGGACGARGAEFRTLSRGSLSLTACPVQHRLVTALFIVGAVGRQISLTRLDLYSFPGDL